MLGKYQSCRQRGRLKLKLVAVQMYFLLAVVLFIFYSVDLSVTASPSLKDDDRSSEQHQHHSSTTDRSLQDSNCISTPYDPLKPLNSPPEVINRVLSHLDAHEASIQSVILQSYIKVNRPTTQDSTQWTYADFRNALQYMATTGVTVPPDVARQLNLPNNNRKLTFFLGHANCRDDGWHVGLANVAAFLAQSMTLAIRDDACDELNTEKAIDAAWVSWSEGAWPISNSCGQRRVGSNGYMSDNDFCEKVYTCDVDADMTMTAEANHYYATDQRNPFPPPLQCYPRSVDEPYTGYFDPRDGGSVEISRTRAVPSSIGRTDVEGCCWWGRGALHTKGTCSMGKFNYYFGAKAAQDGRSSRYTAVNFCANPQAVCSSNNPQSKEMRWMLALFDWVDRVQHYNGNDSGGDGGWNYIEQSVHFLENFRKSNFIDMDNNHFIDEVGSVLDQGCPSAPCDLSNPSRVHKAQTRKGNYVSAAKAIGLPVKSPALRAMETQLDAYKKGIDDVLMQSTSPVDGSSRNSYRYRYFDFIQALGLMVDVGVEKSYFYIGQDYQPTRTEVATMTDLKSGIFNVALFLTQAIVNSIREDACDEHNTQIVNGRHPVSNSCGQYGISYQDLVCTDGNDNGKECPLDLSMSLTAVTKALDHRAPRQFQCAPQSQLPYSGFWDVDNMEENTNTAFANQLGRTNVEGCCWWGRGIFRHINRGRCFFGRLDHAVGKRAAMNGRPSLYPDTDFCANPEAVCSSEDSDELQWIVGMFHWIDAVQSYNEDGWSFMDKLKELPAGDVADIRFNKMLIAVDCIMKTGNHRCEVGIDSIDTLVEVLEVFGDKYEQVALNAPTLSPTLTARPSASPTNFPTVTPTLEPTGSPTSSSAPTASPNIFDYPSTENINAVVADIQRNSQTFISTVFPAGSTGELFSFNGFAEVLFDIASGSVEGKYFYVGHGRTTNRNLRKRGMVNIAAFLAHAKTNGFQNNNCDERNVDFLMPDETTRKYPLSNSCGQYGDSYQDERCDVSESFMECAPDKNMLVSAVPGTDDTSYKNPPAFFCGPKAYFPFMGYFEAGTFAIINDEPFSNRAGRTNIESCCWWGRGSAQVKGVCMYGKLNYYIGARAKEEGRKSMFPDIDFCKRPQEICSGKHSTRLTWASGMVNWIENIQSNFDYGDYLDRIVSGEIERADFISYVSDKLDGGRNKKERLINFNLIIESLAISIN